MNSLEPQTTTLKSITELGLFIQTINVLIIFCLKHDKKEILEKLKDLLLAFNESLSEEEKKEYQEDVEKMIKEKADRLADELVSSLTPEEADQVIGQLKTIAS